MLHPSGLRHLRDRLKRGRGYELAEYAHHLLVVRIERRMRSFFAGPAGGVACHHRALSTFWFDRRNRLTAEPIATRFGFGSGLNSRMAHTELYSKSETVSGGLSGSAAASEDRIAAVRGHDAFYNVSVL